VRDILAKLHLNDFKDDNFGIIRDAKRLLQEFSRQKGDFFHDLIGKLIEKKTNQPDSKFADLASRLGSPKLHLVATNLNTRSSEVFSSDTTRTFRSRKPSDDPCLFHFSSL
jgi:NTE family protein